MLIIDDDDATLYQTERIASGIGWNVETARELNAAAEVLRNKRYDLVLYDFALTATSIDRGLAFVEVARELQPAARLVLCSAYNVPRYAEEGYRLGAHMILHKPLVSRDLISEMRRTSAVHEVVR